ncbi:NRAMP family divalent metal transporter [Photobacterium galatheae]|uniref:Membrane protein n=1 Tax=Photobacterium galatheae TaxID=1654360 RepID=A0A066RHI2_9GAMM|nr:divalent metal cation transporter [Photobacterium galatheae]KDM89915.1 membrane protein [Photobacterium galatheae]MCM0149751.1 divalent metal cation transporter [Photobacterium galatheae]
MSDTTSNPPQVRSGHGIKQLIKSLGPGIMMASAAVGGSHLVASTKAGAIYGWQLAAIILLVNLFKYPFFRAGIQYTMGTGKSLVEGYDGMGRGYLLVFFALNLISSIVNTAALLLFSASLLGYFMPGELPLSVLSAMVLAACLMILMAGHYKALDGLSKVIMSVLVIATIAAVVIAAGNGSVAPVDYEGPSAWTLASFGFIVVMMGWMPAPIEISCLTSLWLKSQRQEQTVTARSALFDFNVGYIGTAILAIVFLSLGALVLYGSGTELKASGIGFSHQLVSMYASTIGEWSRYLIAVIAFFCIFGSTITVIDGYSRALAEAQLLIQKKPLAQNRYLNGWMLVVSVLAMAIILFFTSALMPMMNFAMVLAFMTTPVFAYLNYRLLSSAALPAEMKLSRGMKYLSWAGLVYLYGFLAAFIWWKWFM